MQSPSYFVVDIVAGDTQNVYKMHYVAAFGRVLRLVVWLLLSPFCQRLARRTGAYTLFVAQSSVFRREAECAVIVVSLTVHCVAVLYRGGTK